MQALTCLQRCLAEPAKANAQLVTTSKPVEHSATALAEQTPSARTPSEVSPTPKPSVAPASVAEAEGNSDRPPDTQLSALHACVTRLGASELLDVNSGESLDQMVQALEYTANVLALERLAGRLRKAGRLGPCAAARTSGVLAKMEAALESLERAEFDLRLARVNVRARELRAMRTVDPTR